MLKKIEFKNFKNFRETNLELGHFSLLIGANASGKSNIRDAFRFIHGIGRGYTLAEILGEKYVDSGVLQWRGIRGGIKESAFCGSNSFALTIHFEFIDVFSLSYGKYVIEVNPIGYDNKSVVSKESLYINDIMVFDFNSSQQDLTSIEINTGGKHRKAYTENFTAYQPVLTQLLQIIEHKHKRKSKAANEVIYFVEQTISAFNSIRFLDLAPDSMRIPSLPGQDILGDRGENLSSVLKSICDNPDARRNLVEWVKELTPMDAKDFKFISDQTGRILLNLIEENGHEISAYSASDGTLRFLAIIAALLGPKPAKMYFFEEFDNGIHPTRLYLLLDLVEKKASQGDIQIITTSHSPQLLRFLGDNELKYASLVYRLPDSEESKIKKIIEFPNIKEILETQDIARLHESGWFEDIISFSTEVIN